MAVLSRKSVTKSTGSKRAKAATSKAPKSANSKTVPAGKMETAMMRW